MPIITDGPTIDGNVASAAEILHAALHKELAKINELGGVSEEIQHFANHIKTNLNAMCGGGIGVRQVVINSSAETSVEMLGHLMVMCAMLGLAYSEVFAKPVDPNRIILGGL